MKEKRRVRSTELSICSRTEFWTFKMSGVGAATDLVFNDPIQAELSAIQRTGRLLVLTEWKRVREERELDEKAAEAVTQAQQYASGVLGALELKRTRYIQGLAIPRLISAYVPRHRPEIEQHRLIKVRGQRVGEREQRDRH